jgi:hypothetical protein
MCEGTVARTLGSSRARRANWEPLPVQYVVASVQYAAANCAMPSFCPAADPPAASGVGI